MPYEGRWHGEVPVIDGFQVVERSYSRDDRFFSVGLANIHAVVPGIERNKDKIERATRVFRELGVNVAVFPEFALSGYFWDDEPACRAYLDTALTEHHADWISEVLLPLCTGELRAIVLRHPHGRRVRPLPQPNDARVTVRAGLLRARALLRQDLPAWYRQDVHGVGERRSPRCRWATRGGEVRLHYLL
jgi:hypothetical protein